MRFVLDEDVDASLVTLLNGRGHEAWTIPSAGLSAVTDEVVAVYGHDRRAVVVTHDREFSAWRRKRCIGQHLWLHCDEPVAAEVLDLHLEIVEATFARYDDLFCEIRRGKVEFVFDWQ